MVHTTVGHWKRGGGQNTVLKKLQKKKKNPNKNIIQLSEKENWFWFWNNKRNSLSFSRDINAATILNQVTAR